MLLLAIKLHQHLSFYCSHLKSLCNIATSRVFTMSRASICPCIEVVLALFFFFIKLPQHFICIEATSTLHSYRSHEATSTIHFCHEAMATLHISTEVMPILVFATKHVNTSFALKLCQRSSLSWSHDNTPHEPWHLHWSCTNMCTEPRQNFICIKAVPTFMKPRSHDNTPH